ncbi:hypothetical protein GCK72_019130 [Caenorhabditis remanei]|uniref:Uncharacterized protein n=1 Tax=Caenorhabditis remanei TaxID=31234 RepID=A0A6A5GD63_CAERE|nr:hypothetical protein GCK72_019130 [Caenorhabditis remanei]KAF1752575.1 hypothetical protein GCK72_019130 [Caenorhabditis remanei]
MHDILIIELLHWLLFLSLPISIVFLCSSNDRDREQLHLERRQALRDRQREAAISGRSVRSVIETEVEPETNQCPRLSCVRMAPKLKTHSGVNTAEVYERLNQNDNLVQKMDKEKPPSVEIPPQQPKPMEKPQSGSKESSEDFLDERDKLSAEGAKSAEGANGANIAPSSNP